MTQYTSMTAALLASLLAATGTAAAAEMTPALREAAQNYPALILGANVQAADGAVPLSCPLKGAKVTAPNRVTEYLGTDPSNPDLCVMKLNGTVVTAWYGVWLSAWPGADDAHAGFRDIFHAKTGAIAAFDVHMLPGMQWHALLRNEGVEDISLLGKTYHTVKFSHYREGMEGNTYRSVSTVWKDIPTGMIVFATYNHIAGVPELTHTLSPTAIVPAQAGS